MYIAHFDEQNLNIQELKTHLNNVSLLAGHFGEKMGLKNAMRLIGLIHDMGKYRDGFIEYISNEYDQCKSSEKYTRIGKHSEIDHGVVGAKAIYGLFKENDPIVAEIIALVVMYHHGGLPDCVDDNSHIPFQRRMKEFSDQELELVLNRFADDNPNAELKNLFDLARQEIQNIMIMIKETTTTKVGFAYGLLIKTMYSMLIDADRLDCVLFERDIQDANEWINTNKTVNWTKTVERLDSYLKKLNKELCENENINRINEVRCQISDECFKASQQDISIRRLTVPTGGGKTLSSFRFAINHAKKYKKDRIIFVLPYTSIIEQNAQVIREVLVDEEILEHHSNVLDDNKNEDYRLLTERWSTKIIFTTMVQFLNTFYNGGTQDMRRIHNTLNSVIIFDEIQTVPIKCMSLFNEAINYLKNYGNTTVVLCSATQPRLDDLRVSLDGLNNGSEIIENIHEKFRALERVKIIDECENIGMTFKEAGEYIIEKKKGVKSLLVVVNKIKSADILFSVLAENINDGVKLFYLSSNLCPIHRKRRIEQLKIALKNGEELLCVSTQLIEAGVDISFNAAIRCLCGLDSIAQTAGRVNRNGEKTIGYCYIVKIKDESLQKLETIRLGSIHCQETLMEFKKNPLKYQKSLLSDETLRRFFSIYYADKGISAKMFYPVGTTSIYDMLQNKKGNTKDYKSITGENYPLIFKYNFKTAGREFKVIDDHSRTVIVPYDEGKRIIETVNSESSDMTYEEKIKVVDRARMFSVNIRNYQFNKLQEQGGIYEDLYTGLNLLSEDFYDEIKGVIFEKNMSALFI